MKVIVEDINHLKSEISNGIEEVFSIIHGDEDILSYRMNIYGPKESTAEHLSAYRLHELAVDLERAVSITLFDILTRRFVRDSSSIMYHAIKLSARTLQHKDNLAFGSSCAVEINCEFLRSIINCENPITR